MYKNFSAPLLGISGRQSELIELALTYGFRGIDVDMTDMVKRSQRTDFDDASKYLRAADILIGGFNADVNLEADDETFASQLAGLQAVAETAAKLEVERAFTMLPAATDRMPVTEFFDILRDRLAKIGEVLGQHGIKLGVGFNAASEVIEGKQFEIIRNVDSFLSLVGSVSSEHVGFIIDSWHWHVGGGTLEQLHGIDPARVCIVRLADITPDVAAADAKLSDRSVPVIDGTIDQVSIVKWLAENNFAGPVLACASAAKAKGQTRESIVNKAQEGIDNIFRAAGLTVEPRPMDMIQTMYSMDDDEALEGRSRAPRAKADEEKSELEGSEEEGSADSDDEASVPEATL